MTGHININSIRNKFEMLSNTLIRDNLDISMIPETKLGSTFPSNQFMCCSYNPAKSNISTHLSIVGRSFDSCMSSYDNFLVIGDLN